MVKDDKNKEKKYAVTILFPKEWETSIRQKAQDEGLGVATYIKQIVWKDCKEVNKC